MRILYIFTGLVLFAVGTAVAVAMLIPMWIAVGIYRVVEYIHDVAVDLMGEAADMIGIGLGASDDDSLGY